MTKKEKDDCLTAWHYIENVLQELGFMATFEKISLHDSEGIRNLLRCCQIILGRHFSPMELFDFIQTTAPDLGLMNVPKENS